MNLQVGRLLSNAYSFLRLPRIRLGLLTEGFGLMNRSLTLSIKVAPKALYNRVFGSESLKIEYESFEGKGIKLRVKD